MKIHGLQKMTLLDFPGRVACTVFLGGCDFRYPFCHNFELADGSARPVMDEDELLGFLQKRLGLLDGEKYLQDARRGFETLTALKLRRGADGVWHLTDICKVAGLGPGEKRDGSVEYYLSEPIVSDDAKGVGPWMMALAEYGRAKA